MDRFKKMKDLIALCLIFVFSLFVFRSFLLHIQNSFLDANDYPLISWIHQQNIEHIKTLNFSQVFESNAFYPNTLTLLFSELLVTSSFFSLLISLLTLNVYLQLNIVFFIICLLNIVCSYIFWKRFSKGLPLYFGVFITALSPYFFLQLGHFQMIAIWPFLLSLNFLFDIDKNMKSVVVFGICSALTFLTSVYLCVFLLFVSFVWFILQVGKIGLRPYVKKYWKNLMTALLVCLLFMGIPLLGYIKYIQTYHPKREASEYVQYASDPLDYVFTSQYHSFSTTFPVISSWNSLRKSRGMTAFPGVVLTSLVVYAMYIKIHKRKMQRLDMFFLILMVSGFIFSLGTRLTLNGTYMVTPLPYYIVLKLVPIFLIIRETNRWSLLFYLSIAYFSIRGMEFLEKKNSVFLLLFSLLCIVYIIEVVPMNISPAVFSDVNPAYQVIKKDCNEDKNHILLEYPMSYEKQDKDSGKIVKYWSAMMHASTFHACNMMNGYSGFTPQSTLNVETKLREGLMKENNIDVFSSTLTSNQVSLLKLNIDVFNDQSKEKIQRWLSKQQWGMIEYQDMHIIVLKKK